MTAITGNRGAVVFADAQLLTDNTTAGVDRQLTPNVLARYRKRWRKIDQRSRSNPNETTYLEFCHLAMDELLRGNADHPYRHEQSDLAEMLVLDGLLWLLDLPSRAYEAEVRRIRRQGFVAVVTESRLNDARTEAPGQADVEIVDDGPRPRRKRPLWDGSLALPAVVYAVSLFVGLSWFHPQQDRLSVFVTVVWSLPAVHGAVGMMGFWWARRRPDAPPTVVSTPLEIVVPTVGRPESFDRLAQSVESFCRAPVPYFLNHFVVIVVDDDCEAIEQIADLCEDQVFGRWLELLIVPADFTTPNGVKHKGRANEYANLVRVVAARIHESDGVPWRTAWSQAREQAGRNPQSLSQRAASIAAEPTAEFAIDLTDGRTIDLAGDTNGASTLESLARCWVLHMDDDTAVDDSCMREVAGVIEANADPQTGIDVAQGILTYVRPRSDRLTFDAIRRSVLWTVDANRPPEDISKFAFFTGLLGRPINGFHGENMLVRASREADIGWDFGPEIELVEDARWALTLVAKNSPRPRGRKTALTSRGRSNRRVSQFHLGRSVGISPVTFNEFISQRRRWSHGLTTLIFNRALPWRTRAWMLFAVATWSLGPVQHVGLVLPVAALLGTGTSPVHPGFIPIWSFGFMYGVWAPLQGMRMNLEVSDPLPIFRRLLLYLQALLLVPFSSLLESVAMGWGTARTVRDKVQRLATGRSVERRFEVIVKAAAPAPSDDRKSMGPGR